MVRSANWSDTELWTLVEGVAKYRAEVVKTIVTPFVTASARSTAWAAITEMVNGVGLAGRTSSQIEKKWSDNKMRKTGKIK